MTEPKKKGTYKVPMPALTPEEEKRLLAQRQLQEVYSHLEHVSLGTRNLAWYGQCRALEMTHREALAETLRHFSITREPWYKARNLPVIE